MNTTNALSTRPEYNLRDLLPFISRERRVFRMTIVSGILAQFLSIATLAVAAWIVGKGVTGSDMHSVVPVIWLLAGLVLATSAGKWAQTYFGHDFAFSLVEHIQMGLFDGLARAAPSRVLGKQTGDVASIATSDAEMLESFFAHLLGDYIGAAIVPIVALAGVAWIAPVLALVLLPFLPLVASIPFWLARRAGTEGEALRHQFGKLNAEVVEGVQGLRELAAFGYGPSYVQRLMDRTRRLQHYQFRYGSRAGLEAAAVDVLLSFAVVAALIAGWWSLANGHIPLDLLPVAVVLAGAALAPLTQATESARKLGELKAACNRVLTIFHQREAVLQDGRKAHRISGPVGVVFENVSFGFGRGNAPILRDLSFEIAPGQTAALVGRSGAGKSTCINLLMRFWDSDAGVIRIGDVPLIELSREARHDLIALVPQDVYLFDLSVTDNIRLGRPHASRAEVEQAARRAQVHDFIGALPDGYETICGERGSRLSGGQRQRIAIARAIICNAPVLVMDEAVSNLDTESELALQRALDEAREGRTTLIVAHRLSTIRSADRILVLDNGKIVEDGTHEELVARGEVYKAIVSTAADGQVPR